MLAATTSGRIFHLLTPRELSQWDNVSRGGLIYKRVSIRVDGRNRKLLVHRLVCEAFHGIRPSLEHEVAHSDNNTTNNQASNLRWATKEENEADKTLSGRRRTKLTAAQVAEIRDRLGRGERGRDLARTFGVSDATVSEIKHGKYWRHLRSVGANA
jgi:DNA-binding transcriptional regulator YiaG